MSWFVVDVEADGPVPGKYSMVCFGAVLVRPPLDRTFYGRVKPVSELFVPQALAVSGFSREEHLSFDEPAEVMRRFRDWVLAESAGRPVFVSDNLAFDWQWINYYFHVYGSAGASPSQSGSAGASPSRVAQGENPFGFSGRRIGDMYAGLVKDTFAPWKHLRKTSHTHHPVDDAKGNAEAILAMKDMGLKIPSK